MRTIPRSLLVDLVLICLCTVAVQSKSSLTGRIFKNTNAGMSYTIPEELVPQPDDQLPIDPKGREHLLLALWDNRRHTPVPRVAFLYDTKVAHMTPEEHALRYLHSAKSGEGYKVSEPRKVMTNGIAMWRMDYWRPDDSGQSYNSAIAIPFADGTLLFIQMNALTQAELNSLFESLSTLELESGRQ